MKNMFSLDCSAPGRVCLFGDHMDWLGYEVIPAAINKRIFCRAKLNRNDKIEFYSFIPFTRYFEYKRNMSKIESINDFKYCQAVVHSIKMNSSSIPGIEIRFFENQDKDNNLVSGKGLSSSAALCVVTSSCFYLLSGYKYASLHEFKSLCAETAYIAEHNVLGINCGRMDPYACSYGGILKMNCSNNKITSLPSQTLEKCDLIIGDSLKVKNTEKILSWLKSRCEQEEKTILKGIIQIRKIVFDAYCLLSDLSVCPEKIGELMNLNQKYISENLQTSGNCQISPSNLDDLITAARKAGALGAKVTGSGGGGCMVALSNPKKGQQIMKAIYELGGIAYKVKIDKLGLSYQFNMT